MRLAHQFANSRAAGLPQRVPVSVVICGVLLLPLVLAATGQEWRRIVMLLLVAPVLEEMVFRAGLQDALQRRWRSIPHLANGATAAIFSSIHALVRGDPGAFAVVLPALLIGAVYERTGKLRYCILLHAAMNAAWLGWWMVRTRLSLL